MHRDRYVSRWLPALTAVLTFSSAAQEPRGVVADTYLEPRPIQRVPPNYPQAALQEHREGWVMLSFVVSPTGEVADAMVEDSSGVESLERAALEAVRKWRYEPAKSNGVPVEHSMTKTRIAFQLEGSEKGASKAFQVKYRKINALLGAGDVAAAEPLLQDLELGPRVNLYEDAWFWWLKFVYLEATKSEDKDQKIRALRMAVGYQEDYLPADLFVFAARNLYALEVQAGDLSAALNSFTRLRDSKSAKRSKSYAEAIAALTPTYERIEAVINGPNLLVASGEIGEHDYWVHDLLRRSFSMAEVNGRIDVVDVRCTRGTKRYESFPSDGVWQVPESWGDCGVYIKGEPGTKFVFQEYPRNAASTK